MRREDVGPEPDPRFGKLDRAAKLLALGAARALAGRALVRERTGVVLASFTGCLAADERFDETRARPEGPSPALFPATWGASPGTARGSGPRDARASRRSARRPRDNP